MNQTSRYIDIIYKERLTKMNEVLRMTKEITALEKKKKELMKEVDELGEIMVHLKQKEEEK